ncbi:hypothetical protein QLQ12_37740 [Actinoplanes sp. NEAU-A12]|uniref:Uncharacterized protein n=1 Tax=Actinoplanes sandaracinus TaxID=3045177 RepID=A0ABT6WX84_9ACTN|nr:hypothetical protein [Actinoplanes sandaracinus]MDI6104349.1 hypothetical protein [Actinoplanes sandaracinus]
MDFTAIATGFLGAASLVPAVASSLVGFPPYRQWFRGAALMLIAGLGATLLAISVWPIDDLLYWLGVLLVLGGVLLVWTLRFRTWRSAQQQHEQRIDKNPVCEG